MHVLLTKFIAKHELGPLQGILDLDDVLRGAKKIAKGLAIELKSPPSAYKFRFFKVRIGKKNGGRMIVFLITESEKILPLLIRLKKDKKMGMNMSMNNPDVVIQIGKNMTRILEDIEKSAYETFLLDEE